MKMKKNTFSLGSLLMLLFAAVLMVACTGEQGEPGPAGPNGKDGTDGLAGKDGAKGADGTNGANGVGFDEAISKGKIVVELAGKRPDGIAFTRTIEFPYAPTDLYFSSLQKGGEGGDQVYLKRFLKYDGVSALEPWSEGWSYYYASRSFSSPSVQNGVYNLNFQHVYFAAPIEFPEEKKYFNLDIFGYEGDFYFTKYIESEGGTPVYDGYLTEPNIESYTAPPAANGKFIYKYSGIISGDNNSSGYDLHVVVTADVTVYEQIQHINEGGERGPGREASNGRKATHQKAMMLPL